MENKMGWPEKRKILNWFSGATVSSTRFLPLEGTIETEDGPKTVILTGDGKQHSITLERSDMALLELEFPNLVRSMELSSVRR
jgi:hypothetical protein